GATRRVNEGARRSPPGARRQLHIAAAQPLTRILPLAGVRLAGFRAGDAEFLGALLKLLVTHGAAALALAGVASAATGFRIDETVRRDLLAEHGIFARAATGAFAGILAFASRFFGAGSFRLLCMLVRVSGGDRNQAGGDADDGELGEQRSLFHEKLLPGSGGVVRNYKVTPPPGQASARRCARKGTEEARETTPHPPSRSSLSSPDWAIA